MALVNHNTAKYLPPTQNQLNSQCPSSLPNTELNVLKRDVIERALSEFEKRGINYCGILYARLILTKNDGPRVIKLNCRFENSALLAILPFLETDFYDIAQACVD